MGRHIAAESEVAEAEPETGTMGWSSTLQPIWMDDEQQHHHSWRQGCGRGWRMAGLLGWLFGGAENEAKISLLRQPGNYKIGLLRQVRGGMVGVR